MSLSTHQGYSPNHNSQQEENSKVQYADRTLKVPHPHTPSLAGNTHLPHSVSGATCLSIPQPFGTVAEFAHNIIDE